MQHGAELTTALTVCMVLVVGVGLKLLADRLKFPYTVALLFLGIGVGALLKDAPFTTANQVTPDLILFVFLPVLVFESAFALEVHTLRKNVGPVLFFAGPALLVSTALVAALMVGLTSTSWAWGWLPALVFGALISATDPVAVVALLRELGAPKRLGVLLEGESLLNDGTAIVVFTLLVGLVTGQAEANAGETALRFVVVAGGGGLVGLVLAALASGWLSRTFNQPVVEITLTLALAYLAMVIAEGLLHVSGVIAVVVAGLWMGGPGRPSISPEVHHFLHRFWGMLAHFANTLIFFLVGLVLATQVSAVAVNDFFIIVIAFAGIVIIRVSLFLGGRPIVSRLADPIRLGESLAMGWGGLRGAVSLALALMVAQNPLLPVEFRGQLVLVTAGVVFLTITVNGTTMAALLKKLGYDRAPASERLAQVMTRAAVLDEVRDAIELERAKPELRGVGWSEVSQALDEQRAELAVSMVETRRALAGLGEEQRELGYWHQVLNIERAAYWSAYGRGTLGKGATTRLDHEIDLHQDRLNLGETEPPTSRVTERRGPLARLRAALDVAGVRRVALRYDLYRGQHHAAACVLDELERLDVDPDIRARIEETYRGYRNEAKSRLEDLRVNLPELTHEVERRIALRVQLNLERAVTQAFGRRGALSEGEGAEAVAAIEQRMKRVITELRRAPVPKTADLCRHAPLFADLDNLDIARVDAITTERVLAPDEILFEAGSQGGSVFVVARGAAAVLVGEGNEARLVDVLGTGEVLGEMEVLTGKPRTATIRALTTVTLGEIQGTAFTALLDELPSLRERVWRAFASRRFDNHIRGLNDFAHLGRDDRVGWAQDGELITLDDESVLACPEGKLLFVASGALQGHARYAAPAFINPAPGEELRAEGAVRALRLPSPPSPPALV